MQEVFKEIPGYEDYQVSNLGNVVSLKYGRQVLKKSFIDVGGYPTAQLCMNGKKKNICVHRLVAFAFIGEPAPGQEVNHKSGIKTDNTVENLEYVTRSKNHLHAFKHGLRKSKKGMKFKAGDPTIYHFVNGDRTFVGTRRDLCKSENISRSQMFKLIHGLLTHTHGWKINSVA